MACLWYIYFFLSNVDRCYFCDLIREKYTHVWQTSWPALTWIFLSLGYRTLNFHLEQLKNPCLKCMVLTPSFPPLEYPHYADFLWLKYSCSWQLPATRYGMCHHRTIAAWWKFAYLWFVLEETARLSLRIDVLWVKRSENRLAITRICLKNQYIVKVCFLYDFFSQTSFNKSRILSESTETSVYLCLYENLIPLVSLGSFANVFLTSVLP